MAAHRERCPLATSLTLIVLSLTVPSLTIPIRLWADEPRTTDHSADSQVKFRFPTVTYPPSRRSDHVDTYHGTKVADPYRWLEDVDSEETRRWVEAQNKLTFGILESIPQREAIRKRLKKLWNYERFGLATKRGSRYFYTHNNGLQNQSVLYVTEGLRGEPRLLLDPNKLSEDGTVALAAWVPSEEGKYLALGMASAGSDWREWKVLDVASGKLLEDHLKWVKFSSVSWLPDGSGFYYSRYDEPKEGEELTGVNYFQKLYFHRLGTKQQEDRLVYERKDQKEWGFGGEVTEDGDYLMIAVWRGTDPKNQIFYQSLGTDSDGKVVELLAGFDAEYTFVGNDGPIFYVMTDRDAPRRRLVAIDIRKPQPEHWRDVIPQAKETLESVTYVGGRFFAGYLQDAHAVVKMAAPDGKPLGELALPGIGSVGGFTGRKGDKETFYAFTGFTTPTTIYRFNIEQNRSEVFRQPKVEFDPNRFETKQVFYRSKDGTRVPMFLTYRKGLKWDGSNPTILYAYGGFNISITPSFNVANLVWMEMGGVYAVANLRGGAEYGRDWHEAGMLEKKQNVFDDFIAAAKWLVDNRITSRKRLAIRGGSNGGLLVGAVMTQQPELFAAALPAVGVMDMLRFHKFTIGWAWVSEYGSSDDPEQFKTLLAYSPLHNLKPGTKYPATMVTTADHDDRVVPGHSFKFAAALQHAQGGDAPVLIRIETRAGHGAGTPVSKRIAQAADMLSFLLVALDWQPPVQLNGE